jgi:lipopolysaccharide/colanic/teichoic acid biosynthesis glycosyltransferase
MPPLSPPSQFLNLLPVEVAQTFAQHIPDHLNGEPAVWDGGTPDSQDGILPLVIRSKRINDIRYVNQFFEAVNRQLEAGGLFAGCVRTSQKRKERILSLLPRPFNYLHYSTDYLLKRVWPKLPYLKKGYFALTRGRNRVLSEMETYGRLYACGFRLLESAEANGLLYFLAEKTGEPAYNTEATYGPLIKLRRVGKGGKLFKVYKFRTMSPYSEYIQQFIYERNGYDGGESFANDTRITTVGRFMRKYWIDELPMLWNFLKGELKLFGVRPVSAHYLSLFPEDFQAYRKKFKPGLIPPVYVEIPKTLDENWQIEKRYLEAYEKAPLQTDLDYLKRAFYNIFIKKVRSS